MKLTRTEAGVLALTGLIAATVAGALLLGPWFLVSAGAVLITAALLVDVKE